MSGRCYSTAAYSLAINGQFVSKPGPFSKHGMSSISDQSKDSSGIYCES